MGAEFSGTSTSMPAKKSVLDEAQIKTQCGVDKEWKRKNKNTLSECDALSERILSDIRKLRLELDAMKPCVDNFMSLRQKADELQREMARQRRLKELRRVQAQAHVTEEPSFQVDIETDESQNEEPLEIEGAELDPIDTEHVSLDKGAFLHFFCSSSPQMRGQTNNRPTSPRCIWTRNTAIQLMMAIAPIRSKHRTRAHPQRGPRRPEKAFNNRRWI